MTKIEYQLITKLLKEQKDINHILSHLLKSKHINVTTDDTNLLTIEGEAYIVLTNYYIEKLQKITNQLEKIGYK